MCAARQPANQSDDTARRSWFCVTRNRSPTAARQPMVTSNRFVASADASVRQMRDTTRRSPRHSRRRLGRQTALINEMRRSRFTRCANTRTPRHGVALLTAARDTRQRAHGATSRPSFQPSRPPDGAREVFCVLCSPGLPSYYFITLLFFRCLHLFRHYLLPSLDIDISIS